jgi:hypothetical protein
MAFYLELRLEDGYVFVAHEGVLRPEEIQAATLEAMAAMDADKVDRVLVDLTGVTDTPSTMDLFSAHAALPEYTRVPRPRGALLLRADQETDGRFIEDVMVNRGLPVRVFDDREAALQWLLGTKQGS